MTEPRTADARPNPNAPPATEALESRPRPATLRTGRRRALGALMRAALLVLALAVGTIWLHRATRVFRLPPGDLKAVSERMRERYPADSIVVARTIGSGPLGVTLDITAWNSPLGALAETQRAGGAREMAQEAWRTYASRDVNGVVVTFMRYGPIIGSFSAEKQLATYVFTAAALSPP